MAKQSGLGSRFYVAGYDISSDTQTVQISSPLGVLEVTDITQFAHARLGGERNGAMAVTTYFNKAPGGAHAALSPMTLNDEIMSYLAGPAAVGASVANLNAKQIGYDPARGTDGSLIIKTAGTANGYGLEWGVALTAGTRTDTAATNGASYDRTAGTAFGAQAYLHAVALTGTDVTVTIQHSTDNASWSTLMSFAQITGGTPSAQRIATATNTTTVNRYVRAITTTSGGFTSFAFAVAICPNPIAGVTF